MSEDDDEGAKTYKVVRHFFNGGSDGPNGGSYREEVETDLTLEEAQVHCNDPESSHQTATGAEAVRRTDEKGPWFDGYYKE